MILLDGPLVGAELFELSVCPVEVGNIKLQPTYELPTSNNPKILLLKTSLTS
ncbi:hypothetical protein QUF49_12700 [Fictibacillus sp. b24]|uniref:hypothetical protein n=1 Tax=Fictibacillus sp. b24 TaxID=3055863 RepID=UPI0025A1BD1B|nr:hypothetical protein [Fictibacillus sp. b24]MDM5316858.1 hypothetical protein [Fictibacillus sp. b24]